MTAYKGTNATLRDAVPSSKAGLGETNGRLRIAYDDWAVPAAVIAINSTVDLMMIPAGARVLECVMSYPDQGTTGTGKLGWLVSDDAVEAADDNGLLLSIDFKTAADSVSAVNASTPPAGLGKRFSSAVKVQLLIDEAFDAGTGTISCWVMYIQD